MSNNRIRFSVAGIPLSVSTQEDEAYVLKLGETMDRDMGLLLAEGANVSVTNASILCAIDYLDKYQKANRSVNNMRNQIKEYLAEAANSKLLFDEEKKKTMQLESELGAVRAQLDKFAESGAEFEVAASDMDSLRRSNEQVAGQMNALNERVSALNECISAQDAELEKLRAQNDELIKHLESKDGMISELEHLNDARKTEIERLEGELKTYEQLLSDSAANAAATPAVDLDMTQEFDAPVLSLGQDPTSDNTQEFTPLAPDLAPLSPDFSAPAPDPAFDADPAQESFFTDLYTGPAGASGLQPDNGFDFSNFDLSGLESDPAALADSPPLAAPEAPLPFEQDLGADQNADDALPNLSWTDDI